jgi:peptidyl-prolyl cis-trans isomerase B (cyclophilin B)
MAGSKRERELARAKYERQQARRSHRVNKRKRNQRIIAAVVVTMLVLASVAWAVLSTRSSTPVADAAVSATPAASIAPSAAASAAASASGAPSAAASASRAASTLNCTDPGTPRPDNLTFSAAPTTGGASSITFATNCGDIVVALDSKAPKTVASAAFLASKGFYDNTSCHRLTTAGIFVLQCGDPKGNGSGGPGYALPDENLPAAGAANYPAGTLAMANAGPGTGGSQFFIVYDDTTLPGDYTIFGKVTSGLDIVKEVAKAGVADGGSDGAPAQPVFIESATVQP